MHLTLMRHPAIDFAGERCIGQTDVDLSFAGQLSLKSLAEEACRLLPDRILSSDLKRCRLLAEQIAGRLHITPVYDPIWREMHFGFWENRTWDAIRNEEGEALAEWVADFVTIAPPGGESFLQLQKRVLAGISKIDPNTSHILVVTHAGVIRAAYAALSGLPLCRAFEYHIPYGKMYHARLSSIQQLHWPDWRAAVPRSRRRTLKIET
jgi:alpha-ribazole phosphatase